MDLFLEDVPSQVNSAMNDKLTSLPIWEEVLEVIRNLKADAAPGADGLTGNFFNTFSDIIKDDIMPDIENFFKGLRLPIHYTSTIIALIPKKNNPNSFNDVRPISLCNVKYKIIAKLINNRLAKILPIIISPEQSGFIAGRSIHDNIMFAHDLVHELDRTVPGGNLLITLDMSKAYDRVEWFFLLRVLKKFVFSNYFCDMIFNCIANNFFTI